MKIRNGFVSNSSSSSFVIVCTEDAYKKALDEAHPYVKAVVDCAGKYHKKSGSINGQKVILFGIYSSSGGDYTWDDMDYSGPKWNPDPTVDTTAEDYDEEEYNVYPGSAFDKFVDSIPAESMICGSIGDGG